MLPQFSTRKRAVGLKSCALVSLTIDINTLFAAARAAQHAQISSAVREAFREVLPCPTGALGEAATPRANQPPIESTAASSAQLEQAFSSSTGAITSPDGTTHPQSDPNSTPQHLKLDRHLDLLRWISTSAILMRGSKRSREVRPSMAETHGVFMVPVSASKSLVLHV